MRRANKAMKKLIFVLALMIAGCVSMQAQIFYKIEKEGMEKPSYLFGTHHMAPLSLLEKIPSVDKALDETVATVGEIDMTVPDMQLAMTVQKYAVAPADSTLSALLTPEQYAKASKDFETHFGDQGMNLDMFDGVRPMVVQALCTVMLMQGENPGFNTNEQLDRYFQKESQIRKHGVIALETAEEQAKMFYCGTPLTLQAEGLCEILSDMEKAKKMGKELNDAYERQDLGKLLELSIKESESAESQAFSKMLIADRNQKWLEKLPGIMEEGPVFIAVGALHLPGADGLLEGLRRLGYTVTAVTE